MSLFLSSNPPAAEAKGKSSRLLNRHFTNPEVHPFDEVPWEKRDVRIDGVNGACIFEQRGVEVPAYFSGTAARIVASKYFYGDADLGEDPRSGGRETSVKQLIGRVVDTLADWGLKDGYFQDADEAALFNHELGFLLVRQRAAFNSPVWFNCGLHHAYGLGEESDSGNFFFDTARGRAAPVPNQYEYPQSSACFIQSVSDTMESIMELAASEARLFKYGSGSGTNLSNIRSTREKLTGGGTPSGPLSFLEVYDAVAGVIKSGGKTRRAAKMNVLNSDHPDIREFIEAKLREEKKAWALIEEGYDPSFGGEAYNSIKFQNANLSVRASDEFMRAVESGGKYYTRAVRDGKKLEKLHARELMRAIAEGTHVCGDPGIQFDDTINDWHTCRGTGRQHCSNPCSEYYFIDDSACNLASMNLMAFVDADGRFDVEGFCAAVRILILAQEILVSRSSYPTEAITHNSHWFRPLGLGYANLGALLMSRGMGYNSEEGRALAAGITALMTGEAYRTSAEIAAHAGPFPGYRDPRSFHGPEPVEESNEACMLEVIRKHRQALDSMDDTCPAYLLEAARDRWNRALEWGERFGYRNAQVTVLAPTGTIGFLMDCQTTGIEPAFALTTYKTMTGGGVFCLPLEVVEPGLRSLGYNQEQRDGLLKHLERFGTLEPVEAEGRLQESKLKPEHLSVFDTAALSGHGKRFLSCRGHLRMMAAVQPFLSGGISKTVNVPRETTVEEIEKIYLDAWKMGIKAVAVYRDGSKRSAPLSSRKEQEPGKHQTVQLVTEPYRRHLPDTRKSITHKFSIQGHEGYITAGCFEDGSPGEIFIKMSKEGSTISGLMDTIGILMSSSLQYGVPLEAIVRKFSHVRFEPEGFTPNPDIPVAKSVIDYLVRWMGMEFIPGYREKMSPQAREEAKAAAREALEKQVYPAQDFQLDLALSETTGETCPDCGSNKIRKTGTCGVCMDCGTSLGCS